MVKKNNIMAVILAYVMAVLTGCSVEHMSTLDSNTVDISLVKENNWPMSLDVLNYINTYRAANHLNILSTDSAYATAYAVAHSKYMVNTLSVNHNNFFIRSNGLKERGAVVVAENVAYGYNGAASVVNAWLNSAKHREVIIGDFTNVGFGIIKSPINNKFYYTAIFYK